MAAVRINSRFLKRLRERGGLSQADVAKAIGCDEPRSYQRWESGGRLLEDNYFHLQRALQAKYNPVPDFRVPESDRELSIADEASLRAWKWTDRKLVEEIFRCGEEWVEEADEGDPDSTVEDLARFVVGQEPSWRLIVEDRTILGILHVAPLFEEEFGRLARGEARLLALPTSALRPLDFEGDCDLHLTIAALHPDVRRNRLAIYLLNYALFEYAWDLQHERRIYFRRVNAWALDRGRGVCRNFGLTPPEGQDPSAPATRVFNGTFVDMLRREQVRRQFPFLLRAYEERFGG